MDVIRERSAQLPVSGDCVGALQYSRVIHVDVAPGTAFAPIRRIGGDEGWYAYNWLWSVRGLLDRIAGGCGMRRGRRDPDDLQPGETLDCWRVEAIDPDHRLRLALEMKIPGKGWLEFEVNPNHTGSLIRQTATYVPAGFMGRAYWVLSSPLHDLLFNKMLRAIAKRAQRGTAATRGTVK